MAYVNVNEEEAAAEEEEEEGEVEMSNSGKRAIHDLEKMRMRSTKSPLEETTYSMNVANVQ
jgi:hypothetical protein